MLVQELDLRALEGVCAVAQVEQVPAALHGVELSVRDLAGGKLGVGKRNVRVRGTVRDEGRVVWRWPEGPDDGFQTPRCGSLQVLPGGNLLVTESEAARAFELTRKGEIVWEYRSPERAGAERDRVALLYDVVRVPMEQPWLEGIRENVSRFRGSR